VEENTYRVFKVSTGIRHLIPALLVVTQTATLIFYIHYIFIYFIFSRWHLDITISGPHKPEAYFGAVEAGN